MTQAVSSWKFTGLFTLYAIASLAAYFTISFTIPAWLMYVFVLVPFYLICILYLLNFSLKHRQDKIRCQCLPLYLSGIFQLLIVLTSPASCYGWKQGQACYSFIQTHWTTDILTTFANTTPHWSFVELMFPIAVLLYITSVTTILKKIRIDKPVM